MNCVKSSRYWPTGFEVRWRTPTVSTSTPWTTISRRYRGSCNERELKMRVERGHVAGGAVHNLLSLSGWSLWCADYANGPVSRSRMLSLYRKFDTTDRRASSHLQDSSSISAMVLAGRLIGKTMKPKKKWWACTDLNCGPIDYESIALTN
jgi:hypothetical protein